MSLKPEDVAAIAHLARIQIKESDIQHYATDLSNILDLADQMNAVDTTDVVPMAHPLDAVQRLRVDEVTEKNQREKLQANAPSIENGLFKVPKVID
ncbi:MAG: Asp-tRNA(Asn)/Glu-tRNA(Gln) amidotransferase subunit GatC [Gammaproteobacteria bacterium]|nr:Asp-tRNA(Asn)/Glu-tRNA(Gln) amidotransferase subunit GatC [Gammaproteobacteria bacterium]